MAAYLASRIISGALTYQQVTTARPDLKQAVDEALTAAGRSDLIE